MNEMNLMVGICTPSSIVSTLTVVVATLSVNKMKMIFGNVYTKFYIVSTLSVVVTLAQELFCDITISLPE